MDDLKHAMRAGETVRRETIRLLRSALHNARIEQGRPLSGDEELAVLQRQVKQRRESIEEFRKGGRQDLVDKEQQELAILEAYLPAQMGAGEIEAAVRQAIAETGASGPREQGKVMAWLAPRLRGKADMGQVSQVAQRALGEQRA
jgi:uncharacterized protein YqeY